MPNGVVGVLQCTVWTGPAFIARAEHGQNGGMPMSRKETPELVTTRSYAFTHHSLYAGMLLDVPGSAVA